MSAVDRWLKLAIEGGWVPKGYDFTGMAPSYKLQAVSKVKFKERFYLDPKAWKAVSEAQGYVPGEPFYIARRTDPQWLTRMHRMVDVIAEGKSPEQFLNTIV